MKYEELTERFTAEQKNAVRIRENAVIAAGAGSGKTSVLAVRFVHLVVARKIPVDRILALTFTRKAASEMYSRIYRTLRQVDEVEARAAVENFHLARITTIDAFCNSVSRDACRRYGIPPDFDMDDEGARELAERLALPFFLENRKSPAIRQLMRRYSQQDLASRLFADTVVLHSPVSAPIDFDALLARQKAEVETLFPRTVADLAREIDSLAALRGGSGKGWERLQALLSNRPGLPDPGDRDQIRSCIPFGNELAKLTFGNSNSEPLVLAKDSISRIRNPLWPNFLALANYALNEEVVAETFGLLDRFQSEFHRQKRTAGIMTFSDVSRLAVDSLREDPDLRDSWKRGLDAIMIDEFQDDNAMQRDLLFLLAERPDRRDHSVPEPGDLCPDKLFFVGDEKQSIYRFRGADVSVFRSLAGDLGCPDAPELGMNFRTERRLIETFNRILPSVFLDPRNPPEGGFPEFEAEFSPIQPSKDTPGVEPALDILLVNKANFAAGQAPEEEDALPAAGAGQLSPEETEAAEVARRIRDLVESGYLVRGKDKDGPEVARPCAYGDIAILFRSGVRQHLYERYLRDNGIPYRAETLRGLFFDAPVNDLYAMLRLVAYPDDLTAYATLLRSPLVGIGDEGFALAMLDRTGGKPGSILPPPFAEGVDGQLGEADREKFARARSLFQDIRERADRRPSAELVSRLWYRTGYRYAVLEDPSLAHFSELYDYFFELARQADRKGETLAVFLDRIAALMAPNEKIDNLDIPVERTGGVTLTTVHKSKGLEFPVVFLVDCQNPGNQDKNDKPVYYSGSDGLSVNTGASDGSDTAKDNWFYRKGRDGEKARERAEIRRLLYVAMTRAETRLVVSGVFDGKGDPVAEARTGEEATALIAEWIDKRVSNAEKRGAELQARSFFDLLLPAFAPGPVEGASVEEILPRLSNEAVRSARKAARTRAEAERLYSGLPLAEYLPSPRTHYPATALHDLAAEAGSPAGATPETAPTETAATGSCPERAGFPAGDDRLDRTLAKLGMSATDFGTLVHRSIEAEFTGLPLDIPAELKPFIDEMRTRFFASALGKRALQAQWRKSEYGFITRYEFAGRLLTVSGQMDLAFEEGDRVIVVDYKTDREENPELHAAQLAVYRKAASELRGKDAETWLFYVRTGHAFLQVPEGSCR